MNNVQLKESGFRSIKQLAAVWLAAVSALVVPLYMGNGYLELIEQKAKLYIFLALPALIIIAALEILEFAVTLLGGNAAQKDNLIGNEEAGQLSSPQEHTDSKDLRAAKAGRRKAPLRIKGRISISLLLLIAVWAIFSTLQAPDRKSSFFGTIGWSMGTLMLCSLICSTLCIILYLPTGMYMKNTNKEDNDNALWVVLKRVVIAAAGLNSLIFIFAILQEGGADPFGLLARIDRSYYYSYISTIGQKNSFTGYLCLLLPAAWGFFMESEKRASTISLGIVSSLGILSAVLADSDSLYAGLGVMLLVMIPYALEKQQRTLRAAILMIIFGLCSLAAGLLPVFADRVAHMGTISSMIVTPLSGGLVLTTGVILAVFSVKCMDGEHKAAVRNLFLISEGMVVLAVIAEVIHTLIHFSDAWGTNRGLIWRTGMEKFLGFSFRRKLLGIGPEMIAILYADLRRTMKINIVSAHCEPLHVLLSQGILGLGLYILFWEYLLFVFIQNKLWRKPDAIWFFPLAAYFGQSMFCSAYPVTACLFSILAGIYLQKAEKPVRYQSSRKLSNNIKETL